MHHEVDVLSKSIPQWLHEFPCFQYALLIFLTRTLQVLMNDTSCDIMSRDKWKMTPLHMAAEQSNVDVLKLLLRKNVDCSIRNSSGRIPLHLAAEKGYDM